jgi:hypothetical protein
MDYKWHYDRLIETRKARILENGEYYETHHILPRSMGGSNDKTNLIKLTAREHYIAHWILWRIYRNQQMAFAFLCMNNYKSSTRLKSTFSSIGYKEAKEAQSKFMSKLHTGKVISDSHKEKIGNFWRGKLRLHTEETRKKISNSQLGRVLSDECKENLSVASKKSWNSVGRKTRENFTKTEETKQKMSILRSGENNPYKGKTCKFIDPFGIEYLVRGQVKFCKEHNLNSNKISQILNSKRENDCDGWKVYRC